MDTCPKEEEIKEIQDSLQIGELTMQGLSIDVAHTKKTGDSTNNLVEDIHKRLFIDNGTKSFQTRISTQSLQIKWLWAAACFILLSMGGLFFTVVKAMLPKGG